MSEAAADITTEGAAVLKGSAGMQAMAATAFQNLQPHERQQGHPAWMLNELLSNAPLEAEVWDVLGHSLNAARAVGLPPATAAVPGKQLVAALFAVFCAQREPRPPPPPAPESQEKEEEEKKARFEHWKDMSELLTSAIGLMFQHASTLGA